MRKLVTFLVLLGFLSLQSGLAAAQTVPGMARAPTRNQAPIEQLGRPTSVNFLMWHRSDRQYLIDLHRQVALGNQRVGPTLYSEWRSIQEALAAVQLQGFDTTHELPVRLYTPYATVVIETLGLALAVREKLLAHLLQAQLRRTAALPLPDFASVYPELGNGGNGSLLPEPGTPVTADQWPDVAAVLQALQDLEMAGLPAEALAGAIYLSPFRLQQAADGGALLNQGGTLAMVVGAMGRRSNHPYGTILHLVGHHVLNRYFAPSPAENESGWKAYLALRGDRTGPRRFDDGDEWPQNSRENWAEDFRLAYGQGQLRHQHRGSYGQPTTAVLFDFKALVEEHLRAGTGGPVLEQVEWRDGLARPMLADGVQGAALVTPSRALNLSGQVSYRNAKPRIWISARTDPAQPWVLMGGGMMPDEGGRFSIPLTLGPGEHEVLIEATGAGERAMAKTRLVVITRKLAGPAARIEFSDLTGHWAEPHVMQLMELGAISGYPDATFHPGEDITRGAFLKVMVSAMRADGLITEGFVIVDPPLFEDIAGHWARGFVDEAFRQGYFSTNEYGNHLLPDQPITREEIARIIGATLDRYDFDPESATHVSRFSDAEQITEWRRPSAGQAIKHGVLTGYPDGSFGPRRHATRAETAVIVLRLVEKLRALREASNWVN